MSDLAGNTAETVNAGDLLTLTPAAQANAELIAAVVDQVIAGEKGHGPNHDRATHAAEIGATFAALGAGSLAVAEELHLADDRAIDREAAALRELKVRSATPNPVVPFRLPSYAHPERLAYDGMFRGTEAQAYGGLYALLIERKIPRSSLVLAEQLYEQAATDPDLMTGLLALAAEGGARELGRKYRETAQGTVEAGATHSVKERLGAVITAVHGDELAHLPLVERARQLGGKAVHLGAPSIAYGGVVLKHVEDLGHSLNAQGDNAATWMAQQTSRVMEGIVGKKGYVRGLPGVAEGMIQGMQIGRNRVIPQEVDGVHVDRTALVRALFTRAVMLFPEHVLADDATGNEQEVGCYTILAAMFDLNEKGEDSAIGQYLAEQRQAAAVVTADEMANAES